MHKKLNFALLFLRDKKIALPQNKKKYWGEPMANRQIERLEAFSIANKIKEKIKASVGLLPSIVLLNITMMILHNSKLFCIHAGRSLWWGLCEHYKALWSARAHALFTSLSVGNRECKNRTQPFIQPVLHSSSIVQDVNNWFDRTVFKLLVNIHLP